MADKRVTGAALEYAESILGGPVVENATNPATSATISQPVLGNGDRVSLLVLNLGLNDVYLSVLPNVSASNGILVGLSGGSFILDLIHDFTLCTRGFFAISPGGASTLYIIELVRYRYAELGK